MTNEEYFEMVNSKIEKLKELRKEGLTWIVKLINGDEEYQLTYEDFFFLASFDRLFKLIDGMIVLLKERNLTCAAPILRLLMDNCMRTYASFVVKDKQAFFESIVNGNPINKQKSKDGHLLSDGYLKDEISKKDSDFALVYNRASGYIHLSSKALYQSLV